MKRRGKIVASSTGAVAIVVLVAAGFAGKDRVVEWCTQHFGFEDSGSQVRVILRWDPVTATTVRNVRNYKAIRNDEELAQIILKRAEGFDSTGNATWPLVIDATPDVPWQAVVHLMDLCTRNGIQRVQMAPPEH